MKSWICTTKGFENLKLVDTENIPTISSTDSKDEYNVVVRNIAATLNPVDFKRTEFGFLHFPVRLGLDSVGVVVDCGAKVDQKVFVKNKTMVVMMADLWATESGAFSEYTKHDVRHLSIVPESV